MEENRKTEVTQGIPQESGLECIDAIKAATEGKKPFEAVLVGNIIKYLWRYEKKDGIQDVEKALWYLSRLHKELFDQKMQYKIIAGENGLGLESPWHTLMVPKEGDMFNQNSQARAGLLKALLERGGFCPCQPTKDRDTMCPCKNYRTEGKCICGLFTKIPQNNDTGGNDNVKTESVGTNAETEDSKE